MIKTDNLREYNYFENLVNIFMNFKKTFFPSQIFFYKNLYNI